MPRPGVVLTLNAGSSSLKYALFGGTRIAPDRIAEGKMEGLGRNYDAVLGEVLEWTQQHLAGARLTAVGHRIVHGGDFTKAMLLDDATMAALTALAPLAPLHQPHNLAAVAALVKLRPGLPQVGCFDTAFHQTMDATARRFALPQEMEKSGIRRYGFHGLSFEYIAGRLKEIAPAQAGGRIVIAHLGSGASLCALKDGRSIDTTMSFTPLDGLVMATRCGALDPGVLLYLMQARGMDVAALQDLLYDRSGLLGVSGISDDMRVLLASNEAGAKAAVELFVWRGAREIGSLAASLGGLDGIVFTGGIGENSPPIRAAIAARMAWLGLALEDAANRASAMTISMPGSAILAWVIPTDEEAVIARQAKALTD
jgi:acetate kinase